MAAAQTKYGIKLAATEYTSGRKKIEAISRFKSGNVLAGFTEISENNYLKWSSEITPFHYWDVADETVKLDTPGQTTAEAEELKAEQRERLKWLYFEIIFTDELEEDSTALQNEYDALLLEYNPI